MIKFIVPVLCMTLVVIGLNIANSKAYSDYSYEDKEDSTLISSLFDHDTDQDGWEVEASDNELDTLSVKKDKDKDKNSKKKKDKKKKDK